jgi:putative hydrolase of the HAD superfamily
MPIPTGVEPAGRLKRPVACILFDIYGTLFISGSGDIAVAQKGAAATVGIDTILERHGWTLSADQAQDALHAEIKRVHARLHQGGEAHPEVVIEEIWKRVLVASDIERVRRFALEYELAVNPVWPMPHLKETLNTLVEAGMVLGIISNAQFYTPLLFQWFLGQDLEGLGFDPHLTIFSYEWGCAKPSQRIFEIARRRLSAMGIDPSKTLYLGNDMRNDILGAHRAGFQTALFAGDKRSLRLREEDHACRRVSPDITITNLDQICDHLKGLPPIEPNPDP